MNSRTVVRVSTLVAIAAIVVTSAIAQTLLQNIADDLFRYFSAATRLVTAAAAGVDDLGAGSVPAQQRPEAIAELQRLSQALSRLRAQQMPLVEDLSHYTGKVRADGSRPTSEWAGITNSIVSVSSTVNETLNLVESSNWLKVVFNVEDRLATRELLQGRVTILNRLAALPTPTSPDDLDNLDRIGGRYRTLIESLRTMNVSLTRAIDRLR
jgi:hypothetical protein